MNRFLRKRKKTDIEPQEVFLDKLAQKKQQELGVSDKKIETPLSKRILQGFLVILMLIMFGLFLKTLQLQTFQADYFKAELARNKFIIRSIQASRGVIYDKNLDQLVFNQPAFDLILDKRYLPESGSQKTQVLKQVAQILSKDYSEFKKTIEDASESLSIIVENLEHPVLVLLEAKINELHGFRIENTTIREYKAGPSFSHLLGYTGKINSQELEASQNDYSISDYVGRDGLEKFYEQILRRKPGELRIERDALGNILSKQVVSESESGKSLVLWLDSELQNKAALSLEKGIKRVGADKGVIVALNPKTGGVLALASYPFFDNNLFNKKAEPDSLNTLLNDSREPLFNRAVSGVYAVGSTIKPLIAIAALEEEIISSNKSIECKGLIRIENPYFPDVEPEYYEHHDWTTHGWTDVRKAIAESCNVFFYTIGGGYKDQEGLGPSRIKKYLELFGWGSKTNIDLPAENQGFIPDPNWKKQSFEQKTDQVWRDGDTYNLSIGQGYISITPLQVATAFSAIANGGSLIQPQIVQKIITGNESSSSYLEQDFIQNQFSAALQQKTGSEFISSENLEVVRQGMRQTVTSGSATGWLNNLPVALAAKTGTAQAGKKNHYHNWVTVFGPYNDPEIVLTVMVEDIIDVQAAALPIAKEILEWYFASY